MTGLLDLDQDVVGILFSMLPNRKSKESFMLTSRFLAASVRAQKTTMRLDMASIHSCGDNSNPLLSFTGLKLKRIIAGDTFSLFELSRDDDGDALVRLLQPEGPLSSQVQQRLQEMETLWMAGFRIKSEDSARATGKAIKSLPRLHTLRLDGTSLHPAFYEALAPELPASSAGSSKGAERAPGSLQAENEELDVPGLRTLLYGWMNEDEPPLQAISRNRSLHALEFTLPLCPHMRSKIRPLRALKLRHLAANKDSMAIFVGLEALLPHLPKLESLEVSTLTERQLWELPKSLTHLSIGFQFVGDLCMQLETLASMIEGEFACVRHMRISLLSYDGPDDEAGARQLGQRIAMAVRALPHLTLEVRFLCDVYDLPPIVAFLSEFPAAKSIKEIGGDARYGTPCCDQKQEYTVQQVHQLAALCPDLESLELAGPCWKYATESKVQDCLGVIAENCTNLAKLECNFKFPLQPDCAEAVLAFCTECAKRPSRNPYPLVVRIYISGPEQGVAELRGLKKAWCTRNASLAGKQREVELHVYYEGGDGVLHPFDDN